MRIIKSLAWLSAVVLSTSAHATRWFEVEIIAFKQAPSYTIKEDFSIEPEALTDRNRLNILFDGFNHTGYELCLQGRARFQDSTFIRSLTQGKSSPWCEPSRDYVSLFDSLPISPSVEPQEHMESIYLLDKSQLQFQDKLAQLRRKDLQPLLHTGWRFPEQSKRRAPNVVIIGGEQFKQPASITAKINREPLESLLSPYISEETRAAAEYELEGLIKIHVRHYLYVTTDLDLKYEDEGKPRTARMSQYTRVYSGDIHYLDHPKLGVIFQIRKYKH